MIEVDTGWSWLVCAFAFLIHAVGGGFTYSCSVYYVQFLSVFSANKGATSLIASLNMAAVHFMGPVASLMNHRWGPRVTVLTGGMVSALGLLLCAFSTNIYMVYVSFGFITGVGICLCFSTAIVVMSEYFVRFRAVALGVSTSGTGIGHVTIPWATKALIGQYGWRGALILSSGLMLQLCAGAMILGKHSKPDKQSKPGKQKREISTNVSSKKKRAPAVENGELHIKDENCDTAMGNCNEHYSRNNDSSDNAKCSKKYNTNDIENCNPNCNENKNIIFSILSILRNRNFLLLSLSTVFFIFGCSIPMTHVIAFAISEGQSVSLGTGLVTVIGISGLVGRLVLSLLTQHPRINTIGLYIAAILMTGFSMVLMCRWTTPGGLTFCSVLFGLFAFSIGPTLAEVTCLLGGKQSFNFAYGYILVIMGIGFLTGPPVAGAVYDTSGHYPYSFYMGGGACVLGAVTLTPVLLNKSDQQLSINTQIVES